MAIWLNKAGGLTVSQRAEADGLGMSYEEMKRQIVERLLDMKGGRKKTVRSEKMKRRSIKASNPVLIVGAGPSYLKEMENIKKFSGTVISVDFLFNYLAEHDVIADYVMTLESSQTAVSEQMFEYENIIKVKHKTKMICSSITTAKIIGHFKHAGIEYERFIQNEEPRCSNVGLMAINFAYNRLKADKIILIGFEHVGTKYPTHIYEVWQVDFWYFIKNWPKETIVNCTDSGALYYEDYIIDAKLGDII